MANKVTKTQANKVLALINKQCGWFADAGTKAEILAEDCHYMATYPDQDAHIEIWMPSDIAWALDFGYQNREWFTENDLRCDVWSDNVLCVWRGAW